MAKCARASFAGVVCCAGCPFSSSMLSGLAGVLSWYSSAPGVDASAPGGDAQGMRCPCIASLLVISVRLSPKHDTLAARAGDSSVRHAVALEGTVIAWMLHDPSA